VLFLVAALQAFAGAWNDGVSTPPKQEEWGEEAKEIGKDEM